jgi:S1-C subfamily serine protease
MTSGIISALDRTITVTETSGSYEMTGLIQTSAPSIRQQRRTSQTYNEKSSHNHRNR